MVNKTGDREFCYNQSLRFKSIAHPQLKSIVVLSEKVAFLSKNEGFYATGGVTFLRNSALCSGRAVLIYMPEPSSKPAVLETLGTILIYQ